MELTSSIRWIGFHASLTLSSESCLQAWPQSFEVFAEFIKTAVINWTFGGDYNTGKLPIPVLQPLKFFQREA